MSRTTNINCTNCFKKSYFLSNQQEVFSFSSSHSFRSPQLSKTCFLELQCNLQIKANHQQTPVSQAATYMHWHLSSSSHHTAVQAYLNHATEHSLIPTEILLKPQAESVLSIVTLIKPVGPCHIISLTPFQMAGISTTHHMLHCNTLSKLYMATITWKLCCTDLKKQPNKKKMGQHSQINVFNSRISKHKHIYCKSFFLIKQQQKLLKWNCYLIQLSTSPDYQPLCLWYYLKEWQNYFTEISERRNTAASKQCF